MTTPEIARFNPARHDLAAFRCGVAEVDEFFNSRPRAHNFRFIWERRVGDILVALQGGEIIGVVAYTASSLPRESVKTIVGDFRRAGREKPVEIDGIPVIRIIILGVRAGHRRRGVGTALMERAMSAITAPIYYLFPQRGSEDFYKSIGFVRKESGLRVVMIKILPEQNLPPRPGR